MVQEFKVRIANKKDVKNVFNLSNADEVRKQSISEEKIDWQEHVGWFERAIGEPLCEFFIVESMKGDFIGQLRVDKQIISISLVDKYRGKGLGSMIIKEASLLSRAKVIFAYIKPENVSSMKAFIKAGYKKLGYKIINKYEYCELIYEK